MTEIILDHQKVLDLLPERDSYAHKGDFGKVFLLCGCVGYTGAAYLAAMGALRSGAGLVYLGVPESIYAIEATKLNEAIVFPLPEEDGKLCAKAIPKIMELLPKMDAVLIGCGLGQSQGALDVLSWVMENATCPVVVDADGINLLSKHKSLLRGRKGPTVLTPHDGEFARLMGHLPGQDRTDAAAGAAHELDCIVLLKGHETRISDGTVCYHNCTGNPGMAVGGSGDLLAGIVVSLIGQGMSAITATAVAAWLHGAAGDRCAAESGQYGMLPTDMLLALPRLMK